MKKKNGFTLIELLAIIVILAIIAVITVPIILNIIENSRRGAAIDSAYGFKDAVNKYYVTELSSNRGLQLEGTYTISDGKLNGVDIPVSGTKPTSGKLTYSNNTLTGGCLVIGEYEVKFDSSGNVSETKKGNCVLKPNLVQDNGDEGLSVGDLYAFGSERFYVVDPASTLDGKAVVILLAEYNLNVGDRKNSEIEEGVQDESIAGYKPGQPKYGGIAFSETNYWVNTISSYPSDVYNQRNGDGTYKAIIMDYVQNYKNYLETLGGTILETRLLTYNEATSLGCDITSNPVTHEPGKCLAELNWVYSTGYYLGSASSDRNIYVINTGSYFSSTSYDESGTSGGLYGVRPVIVIDKSQFE